MGWRKDNDSIFKYVYSGLLVTILSDESRAPHTQCGEGGVLEVLMWYTGEVFNKNANISVYVTHLCTLCMHGDSRKDVAHVSVVGAAEGGRPVAAVLYAAFALGLRATCNTHGQTVREDVTV